MDAKAGGDWIPLAATNRFWDGDPRPPGRASENHGEFINRSNQQRGQQAINFFVHNQHGQTFTGRFGSAERALPIGIAAIDQRAPASLAKALNVDIPAAFDQRTTPGTTG